MNIIQTWDFPGGIHPPEHKALSNRLAIQAATIPKHLILPLRQHIGTAAKPLVKVGDSVLKGQMIASATTGLSCALHAPSSGTIVGIDAYPVQHPSELKQLAIKLETDGRDRWLEKQCITNPFALNPNELVQKLQESGISGLGGAAFPTYAKYLHQKPIQQLIINGVECEPYISCDDLLMRARANEIIQGAHILAHISGAKEVLIGIEDNKPQAIDSIEAAIEAQQLEQLIQCRVVPTKYPSGGEKQLIQLLTGKEVPSGRIPAELNILCQNVGTAYAVKRALINGEPLISRITTLTGLALEQAGNYEVLIGTPIDDLLEQTNANRIALSRLIMGGPMMGFTLHDVMVPIVKSTNCIIAGTAQDFPEPPPEQPCIRCGHCVEVCPASLLPQQLYWFSKSQEYEKAADYQLMDCIECGACAYVCPSNIPLVQYYRSAKGQLKQHQQDTAKSDRARERFEFRKDRMHQEKMEKERKRKERAKKAAAAKKLREASAAKEKDSESKESKANNESKNSNEDSKGKNLKTLMATATKMYREANQALAHARKNNAANLDTLQSKVDTLEARAEEAKKNWTAFQASNIQAPQNSEASPSGTNKPSPADTPKASRPSTAKTD